MRKWKRPVYFDQQAALVTKLGIGQVPAIVSQEGKLLRIDELAL
jgi:conjugal transfer pilus assembly protein TraW